MNIIIDIIKNNKWLKIDDDKLFDNNTEISSNRFNTYLNLGREMMDNLLKKDNIDKGKKLETDIEQYLSEKEWEVINVSSKQHSADFEIKTNTDIYLLECKNYKSTVPYAQIDKLFDDLQTRGIKIGIFFSNTRVVYCSKIDIIKKNDKLIYVISANEINAIEIVINMIERVNKKINNKVDNIVDNNSDNSNNNLLLDLDEHLETLMKTRIKIEKEEIKLRKKINEYRLNNN